MVCTMCIECLVSLTKRIQDVYTSYGLGSNRHTTKYDITIIIFQDVYTSYGLGSNRHTTKYDITIIIFQPAGLVTHFTVMFTQMCPTHALPHVYIHVCIYLYLQ